MPRAERQQDYFRFVSKAADLVSEYTYEELSLFRRMARKSSPGMMPVISGYMEMLRRAGEPELSRSETGRSETLNGNSRTNVHLFDLLRSKELFPTNVELAQFASKVLPGMANRRYDKMSRAEIAARVVEYLETLPTEKSSRLEELMRDAIANKSTRRDRQSFFSKWERIIKGIEL